MRPVSPLYEVWWPSKKWKLFCETARKKTESRPPLVKAEILALSQKSKNHFRGTPSGQFYLKLSSVRATVRPHNDFKVARF